MDIRQMKYFKTIVEEGTISKAAKKLHMAQPPLSMQLKQLEEELSVILLKRGNKQIELTEAGNRFYKRCLQILDLTEITKNELKQSYQDVLRIGITSSNSGLIQQESIQEFIKKNKHVQYAIHEGSTYEILDLLLSHNIAFFAPLLMLSNPTAPLPANKSNTTVSLILFCKILNIASLTLSKVGLVFKPSKVYNFVPRANPPIILIIPLYTIYFIKY